MGWRHRWFIMLLFLIIASRLVASEQQFANEPQNQVATLNDPVTLPCRVINKVGTLQWTRDDFGLGTGRNLTGFDRYSMIGSDEEGDFTLEISHVTLEDDAKFQCQVGPGKGQAGIRSRFAVVTVLVSPDEPEIVQGDHLVTTEDREIELECVSRGGKPAADITWIDGLGNVLTDGLEYITEPLQDGKRFTAKSILKLTPKKEHHNQTFTCQAHNQADRTHKSAHLRLEVKYAPKVSVSVDSSKIQEYDEVHLTCQADANPPDMVYKWYVNDELVLGDHTTEYVIPNVTRKYHDAIVKCEVHNPVGKSEESETLEVTYGPRFRSWPRNVQAEDASTVTLSCDVDGNPPADIVWIHEPTSKVVGTSPNLTLTVGPDTDGRYRCRALVTGFPEVSAQASVHLKGPPNIISHKTQFGIQGDNVRLECVAFSIPKPERVVWTHYGREVDTNDRDYAILEDPLPEGIKSTLVIRESQEHHFGPYNCSVTNPYGSDVVEINLKRQKSFPLLMILTGVIGGVIVIIAITMVIILCQRRTKKPEETEPSEKQSKQSDRSSNDSDLKVEIRTASSLSNMNEPDSEQWEEGSETPRVPMNGGENIYRYSADYTEPSFPPKPDGQNNNGYVPYVDYSRDYNPPPLEGSRNSLYGSQMTPLNTIDPRYSATYGNPYLRTSTTSLPPPHVTSAPNTTTASYGVRNGAVPQVARLPNSPTSQYIIPTQAQAPVKRGTLATHV